VILRGRRPPILRSSPSKLLRRPRVRVLALLAVRNDLRFLPGYFESVGPHVDGVIALDDGSDDGSAEYLASRPEVLELIRIPPGRLEWDEAGNYRRLVDAGVRHGADWLVSLDSDERVEREFRERLEWVIARGRLLRFSAYHVRLRELWDSSDHYRVDGVWGAKTRSRIFRARPGVRLDPRPLHGAKVPLADLRPGRSAPADLELYHLRMLHSEDREARRRRYELADPSCVWQPGIGYAYLTDERSLQLRRIDADRDYDGRPGDVTAPPARDGRRAHHG
jgi:hypothetical protein